MPNWNITPEIPGIAWNLHNNYPARDSWDTLNDGGLDGRSGDLLPRLRMARDNHQVLELQAGATYELSGGIDINDAAQTGIVCDEDDPATIVYTGTSSSSIFTSNNGAERFVFQGVEVDITEGDADVGLVRGVYGREFWSKGVTLTGQRDRNYGQRANFTFAPFVGDPSGTAYVENLSMMDGDYIRPDAPFGDHAIAVSTDPGHVGTAVYWQCSLNGWGDNNFYMANSPDGRAIMVDCYSANCRGGCFRMGTDDEIIGGIAEQYDGPIDLTPGGPGHCLSAWYGGPRRVVGLTCRGDLFGRTMLFANDQLNSPLDTTLDRCVVHIDGANDSTLMRLDDGAEWTLQDCYFLDESTAGGRAISANLENGSIISDNTWHFDAPEYDEIELKSGSSLTHEGQTYSGPDRLTASQLGLGDPRPLPEPYFDWGSGGGGGGGGGGDPDPEPDPTQNDRLVIVRDSETQEPIEGAEVWARPA